MFLTGNMLGDLHQKLTDALMQTQEFQQVADSLDRWVNATQSSLKRLEPVAARVRLIEPQIEGFKVILCSYLVHSSSHSFHPPSHSFIQPFLCPSSHSSIQPAIQPAIHPRIPPPIIHSPIHPFVYSSIHFSLAYYRRY